MSENQIDFVQQFINEYARYSKDNTIPTTADQDVKYALELQSNREKKLGYNIEFDIENRGHFANKTGYVVHWKDALYDNRQEYRSCQFTKTIYKDGKKVHRKSNREIFYEIITDYNDQSSMAEELYVCPSCAGVVKIKELEDGCPYCGAHFRMSDLFPRVTNFFKVKEHGGTSEELKKETRKYVIPSILAVGLFAYFFIDLNSSTLLIRIIKSALFGVITGGIFGYLIWVGKEMASAFYEAGRALGPLFSQMGSGQKFTKYMKRYTPEFSFEYFTSKVCSLLQAIIFSEKEDQIPYYQGKPLDNMFSDVLESNMYGRPSLKTFQVKDGKVYLKVKVYMDQTHATKKGVRFARDIYYIDMYRNISKPINLNFSIHKISCKSCGGSFDAAKHTNCPYCGTKYPIAEDEWIITRIEEY